MNRWDDELWEATFAQEIGDAYHQSRKIEEAKARDAYARNMVKYIRYEMAHNTDTYDLFELEDLIS